MFGAHCLSEGIPFVSKPEWYGPFPVPASEVHGDLLYEVNTQWVQKIKNDLKSIGAWDRSEASQSLLFAAWQAAAASGHIPGSGFIAFCHGSTLQFGSGVPERPLFSFLLSADIQTGMVCVD